MVSQQQIGTAYGFFYCEASKDRIEAEFPLARENAISPPIMKLELSQGIDLSDFTTDSELMNLALEAKISGNNYTLIATLPNYTNARTASELGDLINNVYNSDIQKSFHKENPCLTGGIVYKDSESGRYEFLE